MVNVVLFIAVREQTLCREAAMAPIREILPFTAGTAGAAGAAGGGLLSGGELPAPRAITLLDFGESIITQNNNVTENLFIGIFSLRRACLRLADHPRPSGRRQLQRRRRGR